MPSRTGRKIHFDTPEAKNNLFPFFPDVHGAPFNAAEAMSYLTAGPWTCRTVDEFAAITRLTDTAAEFPRIDDRFAGMPHRHGWMLEMDMRRPVELQGGSAGGFLMNCLFHKDLDRRASSTGGAARCRACRSRASSRGQQDAPEGDGWIVQICNRLDEHRSDLLLFDALEIAKGPIATIQIPIRMRFGLHGNFAPSEAIGLKELEPA